MLLYILLFLSDSDKLINTPITVPLNNMDFSIILHFIIAIGIGALVGLEREMGLQHEKILDFGGFRTFILIAFLGALTGFLANTVFNSPLFLSVITFGFILLSIAAYTATSIHFKRVGATTVLSSIVVFFLGMLCTTGMATLAVMFTVLVVMLLALKPHLHNFAKKIDTDELFATIKFALISLVILPFLPNTNYTPLDIPVIKNILLGSGISSTILNQLNVFNPYRIWLMVVFITAISFVGYILIRVYGAEKGLGLTGFLGGLASSTAVTFALSAEAVKKKSLHRLLLFGILIATSTMFIRVLFEVMVLYPALLEKLLLPLGLMTATGVISAYFIFKADGQKKYTFGLSSPFTLGPAVKFSLFFALVLLLSKLGSLLYGETGIYLISLLSGLADVDAITLTMIDLTKQGDILASVAVTAITLAVMANTGVKVGIAYLFGSKEFGIKAMKVYGLIMIAGIIGIFIV